MVAGHAGSGRSNAVKWLAFAAKKARPGAHVVRLAPRVSDSWLHGGVEEYLGHGGPLACVAAIKEAIDSEPDAGGGVIWCIEGIGDLSGVSGELEVLAAVRAARRNGHLVIAEAETSQWVGPLAGELRSARRGLVLTPEQADAQVLFGVPSPRLSRQADPPGRGLWIEAGRITSVQVPLVDERLSTVSTS